MIAFLFLGEQILTLIGIDINSFAVAGSFIIFFISLELILGITLFREDTPDTASIVPIAFPLIAGAGTLTTILTLRAEYDLANIIVAIVINMVVVYAVLKSSGFLEKIRKLWLNKIRKFWSCINGNCCKNFLSKYSNLF